MLLKVINKKLESGNTFSLILEKSAGFYFYAGQYLDVKLPVKDKNGNTRAFTISSSPSENFLMVTIKKGVSRFKRRLEKLKKGDTINTSYPVGTFTLDESTPAYFIAGGIGITPFRSMIKYAVDRKLSTLITLIYSNSNDNFLFKEELNLWEKKLPNLKIIYIVTSRDGQLTQLPSANYKLPVYYLAGPPGLVDGFEKILLDLEVDETSIRTDRFDGY